MRREMRREMRHVAFYVAFPPCPDPAPAHVAPMQEEASHGTEIRSWPTGYSLAGHIPERARVLGALPRQHPDGPALAGYGGGRAAVRPPGAPPSGLPRLRLRGMGRGADLRASRRRARASYL